eukprot:2672540-Pyramimonas_sp.AAC.1
MTAQQTFSPAPLARCVAPRRELTLREALRCTKRDPVLRGGRPVARGGPASGQCTARRKQDP